MPGFDHDPLADVEAIRQLLEGYKSGYPFLKEALQNAQDARATRVWFQWHRGLAKVNHPLLKGPALLLVNDGPFDQESQQGIRLIGLSNRAADTERIGRFGLGIKSLFHVCEGFFYMESGLDSELRGFLTPWHAAEAEKTKFHADWWTTSDDDWKAMAIVINESLPKEFKSWFAIWIPLRTSSVINKIQTIRADCPGKSSDRCDPSLIQAFETTSPSIADSMVFLEGLQAVDFHDGVKKRLQLSYQGENKNPTFSIGQSKFWKRCFKDPQHPTIRKIQESPHWPKVSDRRTGGQASDKANWEGGVAVSLSPVGDNQATLKVFWSVFLPVGSKPAAEVRLNQSKSNLNIFLHGYFFPNRDRTHVFGAEDGFSQAGDASEDALKQEWNRQLATAPDGVLCHLIPVLEDFFCEEKVSEQGIEEIVRGLSGQAVFQLYRKAICQVHHYARCLTSKGWSWQSFSAEEQMISVPCLHHSIKSLEQLLLEVVDTNKLARLDIHEQAALTHQERSVDWNPSVLRHFCRALRYTCLESNREAREYVRSLLAYFREVAATCAETWEKLPLYTVVSAQGVKKIVSTKQIQQWDKEGVVFLLDGNDWRHSLHRSCPGIHLWLIEGVCPPGFLARTLDASAVGALILTECALGAPSEKRGLFQKLLGSINDHHVKQAARYLLHGSFEHRESMQFLYFCGTDQQSGTWGKILRLVLSQMAEPWRALSKEFAEFITPDQASSLGVSKADADAFRDLCRSSDVDLSAWPLAPDHEFLMLNLEHGTHFDPQADNKLLKKLAIHECGNGQFIALDEQSWLEPVEGFNPEDQFPELWNELSLQAHIVKRAKNRHVVLRQQEVFGERVLDSNGIIQLCCAQPNPHRFAPLLVSCLGRGNPNTEARSSLLRATWLPVRNGEPAKIEQLLWLEDAEDELDALVRNSDAKGLVVTRRMIDLELDSRDNRGAWNTLSSQLIPRGKDVLELLGLAFESSFDCHFGIGLRDITELTNWLQATETLERDISYARKLIQKLCTETPGPGAEIAQSFALEVAKIFARPWRTEHAKRYDNALEALHQRHEQADDRIRDVIAEMFCKYLGQAYQAGCWTRYRQQEDFLLLNQRGEWKSVRKLVRPSEGLDPAYLLDCSQASALGLSQARPEDPDQPVAIDVTESAESAADLLRNYGENLPQMQRRCWGAFVALLGDDLPIRQLADELTGDTHGFRKGLVVDSQTRDKLSNLHFRCTLIDGTSIEMQALNGDLIDVPISSLEGSFLVPDPKGQLATWEIHASQHIHRIRLLSSERFQSLNSGSLLDRLKLSIRQLLDAALRSASSDLDEFFQKILGLQEQSLGIAQQNIVLGAEMHLQQLAWRKLAHHGLSAVFNDLAKAKSLEALARQQESVHYAGVDEPRRNHEEAGQLRERSLLELEKLLRDDSSLHLSLAKAMRKKIGESGYITESIPFELFQNADDALGELQNAQDTPPVFVAEFGNDVARFAHWGRIINSVSGAGGNWMKLDLVKMILLNGSDKSYEDSSSEVTGKFGLGFKSVYLLCDQPRAVSGSLEFEVRGATYPARLPLQQASSLRNWLKDQMPGVNSGTAFELPIAVQNPPHWFERFETLAPLLALFARHLKEVRVNGATPTVHRWSARHRFTAEGCVIEQGSIATGSVIKIASESGQLSWLLGWVDGGFNLLPDSLPCLWITAPTRERGLGLVLNGPFEPDPGRSGLGRGTEAMQKNASLFAAAADLLANGLLALGQGRGPAELYADDGKSERLWRSAWEVFSSLPSADRSSSAAHDEVIQCVWPRNQLSGYAKLATHVRVIPNGLPGAFACLTSTALIRYKTTGFLEHADGRRLLTAVSEWPECRFGETLDPTWLAASPVVGVLHKHLGEAAVRVDEVSLRFVLEHLIADRRVNVAIAAKLGAYLTEQFFDLEQGYLWSHEEMNNVQHYLNSLLFLNEQGQWVESGLLLSAGQSDYEPIRAGFAPANRCLSDAYCHPQTQSFFALCRGDLQVTSEEMAEWIGLHLKRQDSPRLAAAFRYLASGDDVVPSCARQLAEEKDALLSSSEFHQLCPEDQHRIRNTFAIAELMEANRFGAPGRGSFEEPDPDPELGFESPLDLEDLLDAWEGREIDAIKRFTLSGDLRPLVFPDLDGDDKLRTRLLETESIAGRAAWYRLLCLGCALSLPLGRTPYERIMRFWEHRLGEDFWKATIPDTLQIAATQKFEERLDRFFEKIIHRTFRDANASGEEADFWRRVFYDFRKMHFFVFGENNLPELILQIASSDGVGGSQLVQFLRSGHVPPALQTPGHEHWAGVVGQSMSAPLLFVMRELRRLHILPEGFESACFYMNSPARRVAFRLGWIDEEELRSYSFENLVRLSQRVCEQMTNEAPELSPYFDLPLQWYAHQNL
jgi:hypothetical protein